MTRLCIVWSCKNDLKIRKELFMLTKKLKEENLKLKDELLATKRIAEKEKKELILKLEITKKSLTACEEDNERLERDWELLAKELAERVAELDNLEEENAKLRNNVVLNHVIHNKNATIVWFNNGKKIVVKRAKGEKGDVYTAVAYALAKSLFTTNTNFKKIVDEAM